MPVEVTSISRHGVWLPAHDQVLFTSHQEVPRFRDASVRQTLKVREVVPRHFHWPDLDVDLTTEIIAHPERFPLKAE